MTFLGLQSRKPRPTNKTELLVWNENCKHHASWCNQIAYGFFGAGFITPLLSYLFNGAANANAWTFLFSALCIWVAFLLHFVGSEFLGDMLSDDGLPGKYIAAKEGHL